MFQNRKKLFSIFGFQVWLDWTWLFLAVLITWTLAGGYFPHVYKDLATMTYWWMGIAGALGLFVSIVFHEMSHSIIARKHGIPMKGITLFVFGGVAEMTEEPKDPKSELLMAIAGPISSIILGLFFYLIVVTGKTIGAGTPVIGVFSWLMFINFILAGFNLIPAFPTDGGRVLRAILWKAKNNLKFATRVASQIGSGFGLLLMILGLAYVILAGNFIGGMWWFLIGMFLRGASQGSYRQMLIKRALEGEPVSRFMKKDPIIVPPDITLHTLVEDYFYTHHFKMFPVVDNDKLMGCITVHQVKEVPREKWNQTYVRDVTVNCSKDNSISPVTDAVKALSKMNETRNSRLMVVEDGKIVGIIALKDLLKFLAIKLDLEGEEEVSQKLPV